MTQYFSSHLISGNMFVFCYVIVNSQEALTYPAGPPACQQLSQSYHMVQEVGFIKTGLVWFAPSTSIGCFKVIYLVLMSSFVSSVHTKRQEYTRRSNATFTCFVYWCNTVFTSVEYLVVYNTHSCCLSPRTKPWQLTGEQVWKVVSLPSVKAP